MKVTLNADVVAALNSFIERVRKARPDVGKSRSVAANQIILEFAANPSSTQLESIETRLVSPGKRRTGLLKRVAALSADADPETLQALEKALNRMQQSQKSEPKNASISPKA